MQRDAGGRGGGPAGHGTVKDAAATGVGRAAAEAGGTGRLSSRNALLERVAELLGAACRGMPPFVLHDHA